MRAGKSTLIRSMCAILGVPLHTLNVHGGMEDVDIVAWMNSKIQMVNELNGAAERIVLFLDEINTCNCMGLFKEIVCDRTMNGAPLPDCIKIIAACNPYRLRKTKSLYGGEEMAGLVFEHFSGGSAGKGGLAENVGTGIKDPLRNLVYRVHPLPESMIDHIFDFGALSPETETLYIRAMLRGQLGMYNPDGETFDSRPELPPARGQAAAPARGDSSVRVGAGNTAGGFGYPSAWTLHPFEEFIDVFTQLVCSAQECVRFIAEGERSVTSLRDVARCMKIFLWFGNHFSNTKGIAESWTLADFFSMRGVAQKYVRRAVILSLAYCYHARLPRAEREILVNNITTAWRRLQSAGYTPNPYMMGYNPFGAPDPYSVFGLHAAAAPAYGYPQKAKCAWLKLEAGAFTTILEDTQREFVSVMNLGEGIALNEALCENLFMILCSILNKIPIFVIGKPGSSKSLAMGLIQSNLNGDASEGVFLKSLPAVEVFSYQCSPLSTSVGIEQAFESSRRYLKEASNTVVVVLLDEVGLAEQSPHLPLKVLHRLLDEMRENEAVVGISNWALDPAKMNRAVHLYRPAPTIEDLSLTAEGMVRSANLKGYLQSLAKAYDETYRYQEQGDFWGLREFYSTVRAINASLSQKRLETGHEAVSLDGPTLMRSILRNFGGRPHEMNKIVNCFFSLLGLPVPNNWQDIMVEDLIIQNLKEPDARHLMLLTKSNAALSLLLDRNIVSKDRAEIIFGSDFLLDKTDLYICLQLQRIKLCMAEGVTVILVHCEALYESLYDLLNQHYVEYGGQIYVRLAFGTYTRLCPIHRNFRVVVIVEKREAYTRLAPPLLNRFEKQVFERKDVLKKYHTPILRRLRDFMAMYCGHSESSGANVSISTLRSSFCGYHTDFLSSLILAAEHSIMIQRETLVGSGEGKLKGSAFNEIRVGDSDYQNALFAESVKRLLWVSPPEAVCRMYTLNGGRLHSQITREFGLDVMNTYFVRQRHSSLSSFASRALFNDTSGDNGLEMENWQDELGSQVIVLTHAPLATQEAVVALMNISPTKSVSSIVLHELDQVILYVTDALFVVIAYMNRKEI
jgi:hypothetical protein